MNGSLNECVNLVLLWFYVPTHKWSYFNTGSNVCMCGMVNGKEQVLLDEEIIDESLHNK